MKYLVPGKRISDLGEEDFELLLAVSIYDKSLEKNTWGAGWVFDATESFNLFCMLKFGWSPVEISEEEYEQIIRDGVCFPKKERARQIKTDFHKLYPVAR